MGSERLDGKENTLLTSRRGPTADGPVAQQYQKASQWEEDDKPPWGKTNGELLSTGGGAGNSQSWVGFRGARGRSQDQGGTKLTVVCFGCGK